MEDRLQTYYANLRAKVLVAMAEKLEQHVTECLDGCCRIDRVTARAKTASSFLEKATRRSEEGRLRYDNPLKQIQDQIGVRIVVFYLQDIDTVSEVVKRYLRAVEEARIVPESDSEFGYFGKHYVLLLPSEVLEGFDAGDAPWCFELQIKTLFQHAWSEANHDLGYKGEGQLSSEQRRSLAFAAAQAWGADRIFQEMFETRPANDGC